MRKLIIEEWISLDGYISDKNGNLDFFANSVRETFVEPQRLKFLETIDCILFGRKTYEQFVSLWPQRPTDNDLLAKKINNDKKIVFSNTLKDAPWGQWPKAAIASGDPIAHIKQLTSSPGKSMVLWGSISLAQALMKEKLVDEYHLHLCPVLTGGGRKFFTEALHQTSLKLLETRVHNTGTVFLNYQPVNFL